MKTDQKIIPEGWHIKRFGDLVSICTGKKDANAQVVGGGYPFFTCAQGVSEIDNYTFDTEAVIVAGNGDFNVKYYKGKFDAYQRTYVIEIKDNLIPIFLYYGTQYALPRITSGARGSTIQYLKIGDFTEFQFLVPPVQEQKKVAEILSAVDEEIQKTDEIISQTEKLKKGLMQDLFTRGIGHKEFKETSVGMIPKEWGVVTVKSATKIITKGTTPTTYGHSFTNEGVNFFKIENIDNNGNIDLSKCKHISETTHQFLRRSQLLCNDILFSIAGAIGRIAIVRKEHLPANTNQAIAIIRPTENINATYLAKILGSDFAQRQVMSKVVQLAQANINLERLGLILIPLPTLSEQKKITDILLSVDQKITTDIKYKKVLIRLKKGLASDLLSGGVRVK